MTLEEATKIAEIISVADGGCYHCAQELAALMTEAFLILCGNQKANMSLKFLSR